MYKVYIWNDPWCSDCRSNFWGLIMLGEYKYPQYGLFWERKTPQVFLVRGMVSILKILFKFAIVWGKFKTWIECVFSLNKIVLLFLTHTHHGIPIFTTHNTFWYSSLSWGINYASGFLTIFYLFRGPKVLGEYKFPQNYPFS